MSWTAYNARILLQRKTAYLLDAVAAAATLTPDRQPAQAACVRVEITGGTTGSGTVTIAGTVDGVSDSEVLTFSRRGLLETTKRFTAIDVNGITTTGLADEAAVPTIAISAVSPSGDAIAQNIVVATNFPAFFDENFGQSNRAPNREPGKSPEELTRVLVPYHRKWTPEPLWQLYEVDRPGELWEVVTVKRDVTALPANQAFVLSCKLLKI